MAYYVPVGKRGYVLRVGTFLIGLMGACVYWRASRRRASMLRQAPGAAGPA